jgi:NADPH-dependent 2,4-dienoyl-CoA reductase/sulfur reductase-like enzyme
MQQYDFDVVVIGGGAAGMAAATEVKKNGFTVAIIEREEFLGGILLQCIHNGFGLHQFKEELTGPEYAERFAELTKNENIKVFLESTVVDVIKEEDSDNEVYCYSSKEGVFVVKSKAIVLSMGCRERNRGNISTPGTRPAGIYTAGLAQRLVNIEGFIPGKNVVIVGSGDIGLIMARRMSLVGAKVHAVIEILPYPSGLNRNIVQCLNDFDIPLYLSHLVSNTYGKERLEKIDVTPIIEGRPDYEKTFSIECDTLLLSVGLIPENEIAKSIGVEINPLTNGPIVNSKMMTSIEGVFACGNMLHVHDLVDYATEESLRVGKYVSDYLSRDNGTALSLLNNNALSLLNNNALSPLNNNASLNSKEYRVKTGGNVRYIVPNSFNPNSNNKFYMRSMIVKEVVDLEIKLNDVVIKTIKKKHVQPSEMITFTLTKKIFEDLNITDDATLTVSLKGV